MLRDSIYMLQVTTTYEEWGERNVVGQCTI